MLLLVITVKDLADKMNSLHQPVNLFFQSVFSEILPRAQQKEDLLISVHVPPSLDSVSVSILGELTVF